MENKFEIGARVVYKGDRKSLYGKNGSVSKLENSEDSRFNLIIVDFDDFGRCWIMPSNLDRVE